MTIKSDRRVYVGAHLTQAAKDALAADAAKNNISMSRWIYLAVLARLAQSEIDVREYEEV
jgi:hypothetical protein